MTTINTNNTSTTAFVVTPDTTGTFVVNTGVGAGTTALTIDASQNATFAGTLKVSGSTTAVYPLTSGTAVASTSGTSVDFTGIPSWVKRITVMFSAVSTNGTSFYQVQIGAGSVTTSGYVSNTNYVNNSANSTTGTSATTGYLIVHDVAAASLYTGVTVLNLINSNTWVSSGTGLRTGAPQAGIFNSGFIALGGTLDRVRITTVNGTDTFDAGTINILWE